MLIRTALAALALLALSANSEAGEVRRAVHASGKTLTLYPVECERSKPESRRGRVEMRDPAGVVLFVGCYVTDMESELVKIDWDDGDESTIPARVFSPVKEGPQS